MSKAKHEFEKTFITLSALITLLYIDHQNRNQNSLRIQVL